jgi:probable rRNA maturation factor
MSIKINYQNYYKKRILSYKKIFKTIADYTYNLLELKEKYELSVSIVDDETIHEYNKQYRQIDRPTDVLSFAFQDEEDMIVDSDMPVELGDVLISYDTMQRQAKEYGHSVEREMCFLFTHGLLHLLGYDHMEKDDEEEMFSLQNEILEGLNILR